MSATEAVRPIRVPIARYEVEEGPRLLVAVGRRDSHGDVAIDQLVDRPENGSRPQLPGRVEHPAGRSPPLAGRRLHAPGRGPRALPDERRGARGAAGPW